MMQFRRDMSMEWIAPAVIAACVSGFITVVGMLVTRSTTIGIHREKIEADQALARQKFDYDRKQAVFKRKFELAEQLLSDVYRFKSIIQFVRNGAVFENEGTSRESNEIESDRLKRRRDSYFVPLERLNRENEFIGVMFARRTTCRALFGPKAEEAFTLLQGAVNRLRVASSLLVDWTPLKTSPKARFCDSLFAM
jgi:hypothetical protein